MALKEGGEPTCLIVGPGGAQARGEVAGLGDVLGGRGEFGDGPENAAGGQPRRAVGDAGGRAGEPGEKQGRIPQRAVIGVRGPAGAYQPAGPGGGVDTELLTTVACVAKI